MVLLELLRKVNKYAVRVYMRFFPNLIISCCIIAIFLCSSCSTTQQQLLFKERTTNPDSTKIALENGGNGTSDYRIRSQDILQIRNLQNIKYIVDEAPATTTSNNSNSSITTQGQTYQVEDDGTVALPVIGRIPVVGLTRAEAAKRAVDLTL